MFVNGTTWSVIMLVDTKVEITNGAAYILMATFIAGDRINDILPKTEGAFQTAVSFSANGWDSIFIRRQNITERSSFMRESNIKAFFSKMSSYFITVFTLSLIKGKSKYEKSILPVEVRASEL